MDIFKIDSTSVEVWEELMHMQDTIRDDMEVLYNEKCSEAIVMKIQHFDLLTDNLYKLAEKQLFYTQPKRSTIVRKVRAIQVNKETT